MSWKPLQIDKGTLSDGESLDAQHARYMAMREYGVAAACIGKPTELLSDYERKALATVAGCPVTFEADRGHAVLQFTIKDLPGTEGVGFIVAFKDNGGMGQVVTIRKRGKHDKR